MTIELTEPDPRQDPIPKKRADHFLEGLLSGRDFAGEDPVSYHSAERNRDRGYTPSQVAQTYAYGREYENPGGTPGSSIFKLNSIDTPGTRRRIVVHKEARKLLTTLPREEIPQPAPKRPAAPPSNTKRKKKEQLAKKRARSAGQS